MDIEGYRFAQYCAPTDPVSPANVYLFRLRYCSSIWVEVLSYFLARR